MANLITEQQKKEVKMDYTFRFYSVILLIISLLGVFFLAYVIPYYISVSEKDLKVSEGFKDVISVENKENVGESAARIVKQTLDQMKAVEIYNKDNLVPSVYLNKIISNKNSSIKITKLSFNFIKKNQGQITVNGMAKDREGLVTFIEDLKIKASFPSVDSPVSDFANDSNIPFTLDIKTNL